MPAFDKITITRAGVAVPGSPFAARVYFPTSFSGHSRELEPTPARIQTTQALRFENVAAPVQVGDLANLPDGSLGKLIDVRRYARSLQADLQRLPYAALKLWTPSVRTVTNTKSVLDAKYTAQQAILGYLEPATDLVKMSALGGLDVRGCYLFSLQAVPMSAIVIDSRGEGWRAVQESDIWPVTGDVRTLVKHVPLPVGVS